MRYSIVTVETSLTMSAVSSTFLAHYGMHSKKSAISLSLKGMPFPTKARSQSVFRSGTQSDPCISSIATSTMILSSNSSVKRSGTPSQLLGVLLHTTAMFGLSRVRTESSYLLVVPFLAHHPEQLNG